MEETKQGGPPAEPKKTRLGFADLFPGKRVKIYDDADNHVADAVVRGLAVMQTQKFASELVHVALMIGDAIGIRLEKGPGGEMKVGDMGEVNVDRILGTAIPLLIRDGVGIIAETTTIEPAGIYADKADVMEFDFAFDELPHEVLGEVVETWLDVSFGSEGKRKRWATSIEKIVRRFSKNKTWQISEIKSLFSSPTGSTAATSSRKRKRASRSAGGRTAN